MAHGYLTPEAVSGESPISKYFERKINELIGKGVKKIENVAEDKFNKFKDLFKKKKDTTYRSGRGRVEVAGRYGIGENTAKGGGILGGSSKLKALLPQKAGIVNTQAKTDIVGRNATNIDKKEGLYLGTADPDVAGGPKTRKGNYVNMPGVSASGSGLNASAFVGKDGQVDAQLFEKSAAAGARFDYGDASATGGTLGQKIRNAKAAARGNVASPAAAAAPPITPDSGVDIVAAVNRNTQAIVTLSNLTEEQTKSQQSMHNEQQAQSDKLASRALARGEEKALEKGSDRSGFTTPEKFQKLLPGGGSGGGSGGGAGGGPGLGIGGKVGAKKVVQAVGKRGAARVGTRLAAKYGGKAAAKAAGKYGGKAAAKLGVKGAAKIGAGAIAKSAGKKIPLVGLGLGAVFAAQRALQGDFVGAGLELASGAASTVPGIGTVGSVGIDAALAARDMGMTPFANGGIITQPTAGLVGEAGQEGVFPLEGSRGRKTFRMFGEGIINAQKDAKDEFAKVQSAGLKFYFENQNGFKLFGDILKVVFAPFLAPLKALGALKNIGGGLLNSLLGGAANASQRGPGGGMVDPTISGDEEEYLMRLMIAEAGGEGELGMAAVGRSVLNRAGLIQSGKVGAGTFMSKSGSITDVIEGSGQYQPFAEGKLKKALTEEERVRAKKALEMARNQASLRGNLEASGMGAAGINKIMASTGFRTHAARYDASQEVNVTKLGGHRFNTAGNADMLTPTPNVSAGISSKEGTGMSTFGETDGGSGRLVNNTVNGVKYVHGHFQSNTGTAQDVVNDTALMVRGMLNSGLTDIYLGDNTKFLPSMSDGEIKGLIEKGLSLHSHSGDGRSVDIFVPKGTPVPFPIMDVSNSGTGAGRTGIVPGSGNTWVGHLTPDSQSGARNVAAGIAAEPDTSPAKMLASAGMPALAASSASPQTGTPIMATSAQVASASRGGGGSPTVINNYYGAGGGKQSSGVNPNGVSAGIDMNAAGLGAFQELKLRSLA